MSSSFSYFCSTIGRKQLVGLTGLGLSFFVLTHMAANLLILVSPQMYNEYSHALISNPLIYVAEAGLLGLFLVHVGMALRLTWLNKMARPVGYAVPSSGDKGTSFVTKTMWHQGVIILVFTVYHLITFKFGPYYEVEYDGLPIRDLHRLVIEVFQSPFYVAGYIFALLVLGFHLSHGVSSAIQSLGFYHPQHTPKIKCFAWGYAFLVSLGFIVQPLYVYFIH